MPLVIGVNGQRWKEQARVAGMAIVAHYTPFDLIAR
jgi:hypothetical protein